MMNVPKISRTSWRKCGKRQAHKATQNKKGSILSAQGKLCCDRKQSGCGGQTKITFCKKTKTAKMIMLRLECIEPNRRSKGMLATKRWEHFELGGHRKKWGQLIQL
ncbi:60S ribosomal protein L36a [Myotis brandtii]|uniref:60S ribosomal protein L36a n=1 Tax=Myotis brandtii TaxID=109478 RepID=S7NAF7_MYOBR|nr:60S ribosomal protein L36a [Myotis brandtii]